MNAQQKFFRGFSDGDTGKEVSRATALLRGFDYWYGYYLATRRLRQANEAALPSAETENKIMRAAA